MESANGIGELKIRNNGCIDTDENFRDETGSACQFARPKLVREGYAVIKGYLGSYETRTRDGFVARNRASIIVCHMALVFRQGIPHDS